MRLAGEIGPTSHESRAVHVHERVRHVQVRGNELQEEGFVRETKSLMQIMHVAIARVPPARRQVHEAFEFDRYRLRSAGNDIDRDGCRFVLPAAYRFDCRAPGGKLELRFAICMKVVPVDCHHRSVERTVGTVRSRIARFDVHARGHWSAVGPGHADANATRARDRTTGRDSHLAPRGRPPAGDCCRVQLRDTTMKCDERKGFPSGLGVGDIS